MSVDDDIVMMR